ncbi:MAG: YceI family protein [Bacteroidota bacterium]
MKTICITFVLLLSGYIHAQTTATISEKQQTVSWMGKAAVGGYAPEGTLEIKNASITFTSEEITALRLVVDMTSLQQENQQLRNHLLQKDFFYTKKYPEATFNLSGAVPIVNGKAQLRGIMIIRGEAQAEIVDVIVVYSEEKIGLQFEHTMDRTHYGVNHNSPSLFKRLKENAIADDFTIKGSLRFTAKD